MWNRFLLTSLLFVVSIGTIGNSLRAQSASVKDKSHDKVKPQIENGIAWYNPESWGVEGRGFHDTQKYYHRFPAKAKSSVRSAVWGLSTHSAGMLVRFATDSPNIKVRYRLTNGGLAMSHMPATGVSGVDLYGRDQKGEMRWINVSRPSKQDVNANLVSGIDATHDGEPREYYLYLPLYNGVEKLEIGVAEKSRFVARTPRKDKPILFYGTSIMHGACASRPGMSISAIVGRKLNRSTINLGFSGNGKMEPEVGKLIGELDPGLIAIDCLPNMNSTQVRERTIPLVKQLRKFFPETPILLVEDRAFTNSPFFKSRRDHHAASRSSLKVSYDDLMDKGTEHLYYLEGDQLLGKDGEAATDGSHPNDLGMMRYADAYVTKIRSILKPKK